MKYFKKNKKRKIINKKIKQNKRKRRYNLRKSKIENNHLKHFENNQELTKASS